MKKLTIITLVLLMTTVLQSFAQEKSTAFKPGWSLGLNGGVNWFMGEGNNILDGTGSNAWSLPGSMGYLGRFSGTYNFTPVWALRGMLGFNQYNHYRPTYTTPFNGESLTADVLLNLSALENGWDANRWFDFLLFAGTGVDYMNKNTVTTPFASPFLRAGAQADIKLTNDLKLNIIAEGNMMTDNTNDEVSAMFFDASPALTLGISYRLPEYVKKAPKPIEPEVVVPVVTEPTVPVVTEPTVPVVTEPTVPVVTEPEKPIVAKVDTVKPVVPTVVEPVVPVVVPPVVAITTPEIKESVFYGINKFTVTDSKQQEIVDKIVSYMNANPTAIVTVSGYADNATGTAAVNREVSKRRAVNLANLLINKYNIPADRIQVKWYGSAVQPYKEVVKNRVVIINSGEEANTTKAIGTVPATNLDAASVSSMVRDAFAQVFFLIEKAEIGDDAQIAELNKVADYLKTNPNAQIIVNGYASKTAGVTPEYNTELSKKRAVSVANYLIQKCGASTKQVTVRWFGDGVQPYSTDLVKNQLVIVKVK